MKFPSFPQFRISLLCLASFVTVLLATLGGCGSSTSKKKPPVIYEEPYLERRTKFQTALTKHGPSPQDWEPVTAPAHVRKITFPSGDLQLQGWVFVPPGAEEQPSPALVYCHGGFAFAIEELVEVCQPFIGAGFVVFCPTLRGENGNPGEFEMFCGEVDDAANAVRWVAEQPYVNKNHLYAFGHSAGGGITSLLALREDIPVRHTGSCSGVYDSHLLKSMDDIAPFNVKDSGEISLRTLQGNVQWLKSKHYAFVGKEDFAFIGPVVALKREREFLKSRNPEKSFPLYFGHPPGDHGDCLEPSIRRYLNIVLKELPTGMTDVLAANARSLSSPHLPEPPRHVAPSPSPGTLPGKPSDADQTAEGHRKFVEEQRERSKARMEEMRERHEKLRNPSTRPSGPGAAPPSRPGQPSRQGFGTPGGTGFGKTDAADDDENPFESGQTTGGDDDDENPFR